MKAGTALRLGRVSNLPTVWTNALAGAVLAGASGFGGELVLLAAAFTLFYTGGMFLNDAFDAPWDAPFVGQRSFIVQAQLQTDAGLSSHVFTLVLDADRGLAIVGANGSGSSGGVQQQADGTLRVDRAVVFGVTVAGACSASVRYDSLAFNLDSAGGLTGAADGQLTTIVGDVAFSSPVKASLTGAADAVAPRLFLTASGNDLTDPFTPFSVSSPEPLPVESYPALRAAGGDVVALIPVPPEKYVVAFSKPGILLRYGETYTVDQESFARTYESTGPGTYVKRAPVWAEVASAAGDVRTKEGSTHYEAGDYLVFNEPDGRDAYAVSKQAFERMYEPTE